MNFTQEDIAKLQLARTKGIGPVAFKKLLNLTGSAQTALQELPKISRQNNRKVHTPFSQKKAEAELLALTNAGGTMLFLETPAYPSLLSHISDAPPVLSVLGNPKILQSRQIAFVGTRNASAAGKNFTCQLAVDLASSGLTITSGLARGIDTAAHTGALKAGAATVAVVAGGIDHLYPPQNKNLREKIIENGCLVSENAFGTKPTAQHFPRRNRIIAGLSFGVIVGEASRHSGSLITSTYAGDQGREVFAIPGNPSDPRAAGPNHLIKQGAIMIECIDDILQHLPRLKAIPIQEKTAYTREELHPSLFDDPQPKTSFEQKDYEEPKDSKEKLSILLSTTPVAVDDLIRQSGLPETDVIITLTELDLEGVLRRHADGRVSLT